MDLLDTFNRKGNDAKGLQIVINNRLQRNIKEVFFAPSRLCGNIPRKVASRTKIEKPVLKT